MLSSLFAPTRYCKTEYIQRGHKGENAQSNVTYSLPLIGLSPRRILCPDILILTAKRASTVWQSLRCAEYKTFGTHLPGRTDRQTRKSAKACACFGAVSAAPAFASVHINTQTTRDHPGGAMVILG